MSDVEIAEDATGKILFSVTPETAKVSVDGNPVDIEKVVELPYGIHRVEATASGYDTLTKHIQVGSEYATISFTLEETRKEDSDRDSVSENSITREPWEDTYKPAEVNSVSDNTLSSVSENALGTSNGNKVYVDSPKDVEVYLDGNYVGLSPVRFAKTAGRHEITLRKDGYESKSYTIYLENNKRDETYSFSELVKLGAAATDQKIPSPVISAVSGIADCKITDGTDVLTAVNPTTGACDATLQNSGIAAVVAAAKSAVQWKVGEAEAAKYSFTVSDNLENATKPSDTENGKGTVSITISRDGYVKQTVSCGVVIVKKAEEPSVSGNDISVTIEDKAYEAKPGDSVTFTATVKKGEESVTDAKVAWTLVGAQKEETTIDSDGKLTLSAEEPAGEITVTATYIDAHGESHPSKPVTVKISQSQKEPENPNPTNPETPANPIPTPPVNPVTPPEPGTVEGDKKGETIEGEKPSDTTNPTPPAESDTKKGDGKNENGKTEGSDNTDTMTDATNTTDKLTEETVTMKQNAHPIRDFFSSLFK